MANLSDGGMVTYRSRGEFLYLSGFVYEVIGCSGLRGVNLLAAFLIVPLRDTSMLWNELTKLKKGKSQFGHIAGKLELETLLEDVKACASISLEILELLHHEGMICFKQGHVMLSSRIDKTGSLPFGDSERVGINAIAQLLEVENLRMLVYDYFRRMD